jgi:phosphoribosyl 1,2-cyclic phosphate phosphodiesterase
VTMLGCGASFGTPAAGGYWGACDPSEPKNERSRASILVEQSGTKVLIDTSYDLRLQMNRHKITNLDAVIYTHSHSDHVNGIDDLRMICFQHKKILDVYANSETLSELMRRWPYIFHSRPDGLYKQFLNPCEIANNGRFKIGNMQIESFEQDHMTCTSLGFRIGNFAYSVDVADLPETSLHKLTGLKAWVVDCSAYKKDIVQSHANLSRVLKWVERLKPEMTYLTDLSTHMDYKTLCNELPPHIRPSYDGMIIETD